MASDNSIFRPFLIYGLILLVTLVITFLYVGLIDGYNYKPNGFIISLNDTELKFAYREKYNNRVVKEGYDFGEDYHDFLITKNDKMILNFQEYEAFDKYTLKVDGSFINSDSSNRLIYKPVKNDVKIKIKKNGNILYYGDYITDISNYLQEFGRYYIHIYIGRKENSNKINTDLSMTFLLVDKEEKND